MEIPPFHRVTVIIIRCYRQLMQEIGWGFLENNGRQNMQGLGCQTGCGNILGGVIQP